MDAAALVSRAFRPIRVSARVGLDLLLPPTCPGCRAIVPRPGQFCGGCWAELRFISDPRCASCGLPFELPAPPGTRCLPCTGTPPPWDAARAPFIYDGPARSLVLGFKHGGREQVAGAMAPHLLRAAGDWLDPAPLVVPVPLHRSRLASRGFNQAAVMARAMARLRPLPLALDGLHRHRRTALSQGLSRDARARNVQGAFRVPPRWAERIRGARVLLVDDVLTTGATVAACARTLRRAGAEEVNVLTWARVVRVDAGAHIHAEVQSQE